MPPAAGGGDASWQLGTYSAAAEQRLLFAVSSSPVGGQLSDGTRPLAYRRVELTAAVPPSVYGALETGDMVAFQGRVRIPAALPPAARRMAAAQLAKVAALEPLTVGVDPLVAATAQHGPQQSSGASGGAPQGGLASRASRRRRRQLQPQADPAGPDLVSGPDEEPDSDYLLAASAERQARAFYADGNLDIDLAPTKPVTSVTFVLNALLPYWYGSVADGPTLKQFFDGCSHGYNPFSPADNAIVGPIDVPCAAAPSTGRAFDSLRCTDRELFGWAQWAVEAALKMNVSLGLRSPRRRVFLLPDLPACRGWESLASVGCGRSCPVFLKLNGWAQPLAVTGYGGLPTRFVGNVQLFPTSARPDSVLRVIVKSDQKPDGDPTKGRDTTFYISYRLSGDVGLPQGQPLGHVYVHQYDGLTARLGTEFLPVLVGSSAALQPDGSIPLSPAAADYFRLRLVSRSGSSATVHACVTSWGPLPASEGEGGDCEACSDGRDNDCNGKTDEEDESCAACWLY
ncbi:hypothetical protein GPECTOR_60g774 [Gonium pectorale]|uniref:Uncharacterized protein n=1 Tax=Gonium pectorale TaxID=33097 RepID=A0A150G648_GONPE|nr:hypothetical protein GPECTOR_60g774 [Gonium pectorale]|eukprot:KXZ44995.1 hypothetical protein GPECTOR_60g774 [Gonium pectorale]